MDAQTQRYGALIEQYAKQNYRKMFREPHGLLQHKFIVPGSVYGDDLWDWDSWLTNIALRQIADGDDIAAYEQGCIRNFLDHTDGDGRMPLVITSTFTLPHQEETANTNIHKPVLAQHALFVAQQNGDFAFLADGFDKMERFIGYYDTHCRHETGLYYWLDDLAIGVDNDPCTFYRPAKSSGSIYLNCLMYRELLAMAAIAAALGRDARAAHYTQKAEALREAVRTHCFDERDGFYYSVDLNLLPIDPTAGLHSGCPRHWHCLIQRIGVWSGFLAMWAGIATPDEATRMVREHYHNDSTFHAPYGVRSLSRMEKMYALIPSGNPSCWLGPIWGVVNYMVFEGLRAYGYTDEAREIAEKTVAMLGRDIEQNGEMHEYYHPETGDGMHNPGFQNWNLLAVNMFHWLQEQ